MQRYRVNYPLLIGLAVGGVAAIACTYFLWKFQVTRNANRLLDKANVADAEGNVEDAFQSLVQFVRLRKDEDQVEVNGRTVNPRVLLGEVSIKLAEQDELDRKVRLAAYQTAVESVKGTNDAKLRRQLVELQTKFGAIDLALQNINELLDNGQGDADLSALKAQCLFNLQNQAEGANWCYKIIGYDSKADKFDAAKGEAAKKPVVYRLLSLYLRNTNKPEMADRVIEQMVKANPDSREACIFQYQYLRSIDKRDEARVALDKAYQLEPTDASVLASKGMEALSDYYDAVADAQAKGQEKSEEADKQLAEAGKFFNEALERYPDRIEFYQQCAQIQLMLDNKEQGLAILDKGIQKFPPKTSVNISGVPLSFPLLILKLDAQIEQKDFLAAQQLVKEIRDLNNERVAPVADFYEARLLAINEKWAEAAARMADVKGRLLGFTNLQAMAGAIEGFCQMQLGNVDLARAAYEWALNVNPKQPQATVGLSQINAANPSPQADDRASNIDSLVRQTINKPKEQQDWAAVDSKIDAIVDEQAALHPGDTWAASRKALVRGQALVMRAAAEIDETQQKALFGEARKAIQEAYRIDNQDPTIQIAVVRLLAQQPGSGPETALKRLDDFVAKSKDDAQWRSLRVELLAMIHGDNLPQQLEDATKGMDDWPAAHQAMVWSTVGTRYEQIGKYADAQRCLEKTIELAPNNLPARFELFDLALKQGDDAGMRRAQSRILEIVKSESDPGYVLSEVKRRMVGQQTGASTPEELKEARQMLDAAIKQRSNYADLYVSSGQLYMLLENNPDEAMASFKKAIELGANNLTAIAIEIRLLAERGRIAEARKLMDRIPSQAWTAVLDRTAAEVLLAVGDSDRAYAEAEKIAKAKSEDPATQVWFADLAAGRLPQQRVASTDGNAAPKTPHPEAAETALKKAISLNRSDPELWTRLVTLYLQLKRPEDVEKTLREAHLALDEEYLPMLIAKYYELQSRWQEAEDIYLAIYAGRPADDVFVARRMAEFYLTWASKNEANKGKAAVYLNRILRAANEGKLGKDDPNRPWARIQAAKLLAATGDYVDSVKAEKLLASAMEKGTATPEIEDLLVDVLSNRQDPTSRERAVALLRQIRQKRGLTWSREVLMGDLLNQLGDWEGAKKQMEQAIGRFPKQYEVETAYISMLIQHKEFPAAELRITRLSSNKDAQPGLGQLRLNLAAAQGKKDVVRSTLTGMTPNLKGAISEKQLKFLRELSILADSVGDHEYALTLMREYARRAKGSELEFARLTALYGDIDEGFTMLRALMNTNMDDVIQIAIEVLRARRAEAPDKLDEEVGRIVRQGLRDDPESAKRLIIEAEMLEVQEKFPESIEAYKRILARDDVPPRIRAGAANNMAFLVALQGAKKEDLTLALKYVNQAIDVMGPISDILDTRALIYISLGQFADAVADMQMAVKMNITPSKYFHLAEAQLGAGDQKGAKATWELAKQQGFKPESVPKPEQGRLQQFMKQMESVALTPQL